MLKLWIWLSTLGSLYAGIWFGGFLGSDGTFLQDQSWHPTHESMWIDGVSRRIFVGYMFQGMGLLRLPLALEWSWDHFKHDFSAGEREASYDLAPQAVWIARPGIHLGDGFVYALGSIESTQLSESLVEGQYRHQQTHSLFPYVHWGMGVAFAVAPQTELMAEARFSSHVSQKIYAFVRGREVALLDDPSDFLIHNNQIFLGLSYSF